MLIRIMYLLEANLHSTVVLLKGQCYCDRNGLIRNLHSTVVLLKVVL